MKGLSLIEAIVNIGNSNEGMKELNRITGIQYEDGSGFKFNYQVNGGDWKFIDLSNYPELIQIDNLSGYNRPKQDFDQEQSSRH